MKYLELDNLAREVPVTGYLHYRDFLKALFVLAKSRDGNYSHEKFCEDLGFAGGNTVRLTISGHRKLSVKGAERVIQALKLTGTNRRYLLQLVKYNNARLLADRERYLQALLDIKSQSLTTVQDQKSLEYLTEWFFPVIREMAAMDDFKPDATWISSKLYGKLLPKQIQTCIETLETLGLITYDKGRGRYVRTDEQVSPARTVNELAIMRYHQTMLEIAKESLTRVEGHRLDVNALTVCISEKTAAKIRERLHAVCEEVFALERENSEPEHVYQINIQLFPLTRAAAKKELK